MASIQNTFSYENTTGQTEYDKVTIEVIIPKFSFRISDNNEIKRYISGNEIFNKTHSLQNESYLVNLPLNKLVETDIKDIYGFFLYHFIEVINAERNINDFSFQFTVNLKDQQGQELASETFEGIYYQKAASSSDYDVRNYFRELSNFEQTYGPLNKLNSKGLQRLPKTRSKSVFIINKESYELFKYIFSIANSDQVPVSDGFVLDFIQILTDLSDKYPKLSTTKEVISYTQLVDFFKNKNYKISNELYQYISDNFSKLFDFPLSLPEIQPLDILGTLEIISENELSKSDLDFYDFTLEYPGKNNEPKILRYNWSKYDDEIDSNKINFNFSNDETILTSSITGFITVKIKGYDGAILWEEQYAPSDSQLKNLEIIINEYRAGSIAPETSTGRPKSSKRIRGRVLQNADKYNLDGLTIIIQAKKEGDDLYRIVSATKSDKSGNFSLDYPYGDYLEAQALVSLMPNSPADLVVDSEKSNETISDDFIFLLLTDENVIEYEDAAATDEDCDCHTPNKAKRLPDQVDLIESDEYTQDIGGTCLNLSTPNRTLKEYSYNAIVRISDPDVSNYILQKNESNGKVQYDLLREGEKISRGVVDLDNPIRWEDAPDAKENLSIYQAVTVATGHILYFKSVFKADGYSLGDLVYSLPLAPGQKKQIVVFESSHSLTGAESQSISQGESLSAGLLSDRYITDELTGGIGENLSGRSKAHTSGMSAGLGASASYGGIGASLGVAGGFSNSNSSASQNSSRNISQFFGEKLRQSLMQNAESYRQLNASVVTTVTEGQDYGVTSEVVANHNHCHSLTMMYFEVLRHYAIFQEISHVEECVFVPLLMTHFTTENIHKWKDVIAPNLLPIPSNTYLQPFSYFLKRKQHPLLIAFDANERIKTEYTRVEFPENTYADETIDEFTGYLKFNVHIPRPKTRFDRILSFPIIRTTVTTDAGVDVGGTIRENVKDTIVASVVPCAAKGPSIKRNTTSTEVLSRGRIFDMFMDLDENFETVPPAQCIRVRFDQTNGINVFRNFIGIVFDGDSMPTNMDFFAGMETEKRLWESYAAILGMPLEELFQYFNGNVIADWDRIFNEHIAPQIIDKLINDETISISPLSNIQLTARQEYKGGSRQLIYDLRDGTTSITRKSITNIDINYTANFGSLFTSVHKDVFFNYITFKLESIQIKYTTAFNSGVLINRIIRDNLVDGVPDIPTPLNSSEKKNPRKEDEYIVNELIEHLNSNIEYYNKLLWTNLDPDRRYMLLDGFNIQTYTSTGHRSVMRSLASVVKNELITITGNSLVFPVSDGFRVGRDSILEEIGDGVHQEISLLDHYKPLTPVPPYRISVPTRGVFMEAIQGSCDACEMVKENSSQDWDKFRTEEPTPIATVVTPTPTITDYKPQYKDFAQPLVNIQNAPDAPAPAAGLAQLNELLGKAGVFNDITGLAGNQDNAIRTYLSNQENAKAFAEMSKSLATQQHNTSNTESISDGITRARAAGTITDEDAQSLTRQHLQQQIDGGESLREAAQFERESTRPSLAEVAAAAANRGQAVQAQHTDADGTHESIGISGRDGSSLINEEILNIEALRQPSSMACWATASTIMMNWKNRSTSSIETILRTAGDNLEPPNEDFYITIFNDNTGLLASQKEAFINALGMVGEAPASYPLSQYVEWLRNYGPLWITTDAAADAQFSPHARILTRISGDSNDLENVLFTFINPSSGNEESETFSSFIESFEQMATDIEEDSSLFIQIVHFRELRERVSSEGQSTTPRTWMPGLPSHNNMSRVKNALIRHANDEYDFWHSNPTPNPPGQPGPTRVGNVYWERDPDPVRERLIQYWLRTYETNSEGLVNPGTASTDRASAISKIDRKTPMTPAQETAMITAEGLLSGQDAWSAAFISYVVAQAGITSNDVFPCSIRHVDYIANAIRNLENRVMENPFWGYEIGNYIPVPGDLVCRSENGTYRNIYNRSTNRVPRRGSHVDIVTEVHWHETIAEQRFLIVIGGNVECNRIYLPPGDPTGISTEDPNDILNVSVGKRKIYLDQHRKIDRTKNFEIIDSLGNVQFRRPQRDYFAIIKVRTDRTRA